MKSLFDVIDLLKLNLLYMIKRNSKDQKPVLKTKEGKVQNETSSSSKSTKNTKAGFVASLINKDPDNNLVYLYW